MNPILLITTALHLVALGQSVIGETTPVQLESVLNTKKSPKDLVAEASDRSSLIPALYLSREYGLPGTGYAAGVGYGNYYPGYGYGYRGNTLGLGYRGGYQSGGPAIFGGGNTGYGYYGSLGYGSGYGGYGGIGTGTGYNGYGGYGGYGGIGTGYGNIGLGLGGYLGGLEDPLLSYGNRGYGYNRYGGYGGYGLDGYGGYGSRYGGSGLGYGGYGSGYGGYGSGYRGIGSGYGGIGSGYGGIGSGYGGYGSNYGSSSYDIRNGYEPYNYRGSSNLNYSSGTPSGYSGYS